MNRLTEDLLARGQIGGIEPGTWSDRNGTFDPVEAGVALALLGWPSGEAAAPESASSDDSTVDEVAEYMGRETAYVEAVPPKGVSSASDGL